jgi:cell fate regulator YaaT (PSP1 superfamily)
LDAGKLARSKARDLQLTMKIVATHYTFDLSPIIVTFGAEGWPISGHYCASWEPPCDAA